MVINLNISSHEIIDFFDKKPKYNYIDRWEVEIYQRSDRGRHYLLMIERVEGIRRVRTGISSFIHSFHSSIHFPRTLPKVGNT